MSDKETVEKKDTTERRVYNLPADLLERLRAYQVSQGIASEVEAARRLLHIALQMRDSVTDILSTLEAKFADEKDLRVLAGDVLSKHILVDKIQFGKGLVVFVMENGDRGMIQESGTLFYADSDDRDDDWTSYKRKPTGASPSWDAGKGDLDDEIPF
jgi:hypothetical protein